MPEDDLIQRERQFTQGELKALRFEADDFEYDPYVRGAKENAMMDGARIRTTKVNLKRMRDERFETWSRRVADRQERQDRQNQMALALVPGTPTPLPPLIKVSKPI